MATTFEIDDKIYELHLSRKALKGFERTQGPIVNLMQSTNGNLSLDNIDAFFAVGLYYADGGKVSPQQSVEVSEQVMDKYGYYFAAEACAEALMNDCAFLLRGAEPEETIG